MYNLHALTRHYRYLIKVEPHLFETGEKLGTKTSSFRASLSERCAHVLKREWFRESSCMYMRWKTKSYVFPYRELSGTTSPPFQLPSTPVQRLNATISDIDVRNIAIQNDTRYSVLSPSFAPFTPSVTPRVVLPFSQ